MTHAVRVVHFDKYCDEQACLHILNFSIFPVERGEDEDGHHDCDCDDCDYDDGNDMAINGEWCGVQNAMKGEYVLGPYWVSNLHLLHLHLIHS